MPMSAAGFTFAVGFDPRLPRLLQRLLAHAPLRRAASLLRRLLLVSGGLGLVVRLMLSRCSLSVDDGCGQPSLKRYAGQPSLKRYALAARRARAAGSADPGCRLLAASPPLRHVRPRRRRTGRWLKGGWLRAHPRILAEVQVSLITLSAARDASRKRAQSAEVRLTAAGARNLGRALHCASTRRIEAALGKP